MASAKTGSAGSDRAVLVTGATGFIGWHLCEALDQAGYEVHTLSRHPKTTGTGMSEREEEKEKEKESRHHVCDLTRDVSRLRSILHSRPWYAVCHLAGLISYDGREGDKLHLANVEATRTIVEEITKCGEEGGKKIRLVYCSSVAAVGCNRTMEELPLTEDTTWDTALDQIAYMRTKRLAEDVVRNAARQGLIHATCVCPSNVYGARDGLKGSRSTQVRAANGQSRFYTHGGVSVVHISVLIHLFLSLLQTGDDDNDDDNDDEDEAVWRGSRWLVTGDNISVQDMLRLCAQAAGRDPTSVATIRLPTALLHLCALLAQTLGFSFLTVDRVRVATAFHWYDGERARTRFNLPHVPARDAILDSVRWMQQNGLVSSVSK